MNINIINYEEALGYDGILSKYANAMRFELQRLGHTVTILGRPIKKADINHHINYESYVYLSGTRNTLMVTHITDEKKLETLKKGMRTADIGICFSHETEEDLKKKNILKLTTVLPAHDSIERRPRMIAIVTNVYPSGCKREKMFVNLLNHIDKKKYVFMIMGTGWERTLDSVVGTGFVGQYHPKFEHETYQKILQLADYFLYFGKDEGAMSILDATYAGIKCIAPNIGFHKELNIAYPFDTQDDLENVFKKLEENPADEMTWENYCKQHIKIWEKLLS